MTLRAAAFMGDGEELARAGVEANRGVGKMEEVGREGEGEGAEGWGRWGGWVQRVDRHLSSSCTIIIITIIIITIVIIIITITINTATTTTTNTPVRYHR